jgi:two-component system nitrogen regulation sensor histidine kinase GlnL
MLHVSVHTASKDSQSGVEVRIADSGPGIPAELREQIFNPFMTTKKSGVGLGLAIVSKILDEHRGSITLAETENGACFLLFFPAAEREVSQDSMAVKRT